MAEWSIAAVLKTVVLRGTGGSNPSLSARKRLQVYDLQPFLLVIIYLLTLSSCHSVFYDISKQNLMKLLKKSIMVYKYIVMLFFQFTLVVLVKNPIVSDDGK